ncbi:MAG: hypothetical protein ABEI53_00355 [Candidatus Magasanikbacteria bacterium]
MDKLHFNCKETSLVPSSEMSDILSSLESYHEHLKEVYAEDDYSYNESSLNLPSDSRRFEMVETLGENKSSTELKYIFLVGIGGSNLGAKAVYDALRGKLGSLSGEFPKLVFVDTVDPSLLRSARSVIKNDIEDPKEFALAVVSKSGNTTETIANFEVLVSALKEEFDNFENRIVAITDEGSSLDSSVSETDIDTLYIPDKVGGRFSVLSAVGILPLYLSEVDVYSLMDGAKKTVESCLGSEIGSNPAAISASLQYWWSQNGVNISNNFFFDPDLESLGKWYRQLMAESLGKEKNREGQKVNIGITPVASIGSTDLHSQAQLYFGGPKDKFTNLVYVSSGERGPSVPEKLYLGDIVSGVKGQDIHSLMDALYGGVKEAYKKNNLPFVETVLDSVSAEPIGSYLQFKMMEIMYLGELLNVNAFNQPSVEDYKEETRKILES